MPDEPRFEEEYEPRQVEAARRTLVDVMQVLAAYHDSIVLVGGWVPDLLLPEAIEKHVGSIDVDLALDAENLGDGRYAELLKLLLGTRRYRHGELGFQFVTDVDLGDGEQPIEVLVEFLAPREIKFKKNRPKLLEEFRVLQADGCGAAFHGPEQTKLAGKMINGTENVVSIQVAALPDFLIMKAFALSGRDKPKDAYDICYCLENDSGGIEVMAGNWHSRRGEEDVEKAFEILGEKFATENSYGPMQVAEFHQLPDQADREIESRRAFELVKKFISLVEG